ncbi:putative Inosine monophosphate dehydrogenase-related protein [Vibrio nigripulchritudo MADA3029]|uniref:Inosine monophosphate dehydrogenase-related protein n=2 Tax=Vibrio nigripulchritudo TaxID=28173 RepID=A0AAV2VSF6_9VIBR|nr:MULTISPECIES: CBS domain-containing protein [Vibrio]EGU61216.1 inosine monophosphate dehydrogenase-like protein [Vibrio nigripulchritudo ATCC 27043]KJY80667.1 CBS domain containing protein [Vibrio nigripulchritudo]UAB71526.1 CBS domain-containing protein [Vibrio sp. SCSIO 43132]CCN34097.1 putative Inosine monophosphate dehydrogenase-related protein [Vibrio nigripulchritudo AM115]CCN40467.1 putative Inosine monophosphate dehydrogenase-related protein [Vibrio nigripulchritudo FTn2]
MESLKVKDYMVHHAVTFTKDMSLTAALDKVMSSKHMGGPVLDERKQVIGFLSEQDLLDKLVKVSYYCQDTHIVADCMSTDVLTVSPEMSVIELADMMKVGKPKVYPVVNSDGKLLGIVTRTEVLRAIGINLKDCFQHPV